MSLFKEIVKKNKKEKLIENGDKIVIGFSGGPDSVFMTHMLLKLKEIIDFDMVLVHINHMLRGEEANGDENFSIEYGRKHGIEVFSKRVDVEAFGKSKKITLEEAGREVRYSFYKEILEKTKSNKIALAHNKDDQLETFLFRMIRGSGLNGLEGIASKRDNYIRPISEIYKKDIVEYLDENGVEYRIDKTNFENEFTRNSIRLDLIPFIEQRYNPKFKDKLYALIEEIRDVNETLNGEIDDIVKEEVLDIGKLMRFNKNLRGKIISKFLYKYNIVASRENIFQIEGLLSKGGSSSVDLKDGYILKKEYQMLKVEKSVKEERLGTSLLNIPGKVVFGEYEIEATIEVPNEKNKNCFYTNLNVDKVLIRTRKDGDRLIPCGMKGEKKLKDIFINEKVPKDKRDKIPLIVHNDEILWIAGIRGNEKYKNIKEDKCIKFIVRRAK